MGAVERAMTTEDRLNALLADRDLQIESLTKVNDILSCRKERDGLQTTVVQQQTELKEHRHDTHLILFIGFLSLIFGFYIGLALGIWSEQRRKK